MRRLVVGDVHGCHAELLALIEEAGIGAEDEVIALGDVVDRGPDSAAVLELIRSRPRTRSLMGNHERKHVRILAGDLRPSTAQRLTRWEMGEEAYRRAVAFMATFPSILVLPEAILVHGAFEPGVEPERQRQAVLLGTMSGGRYLERAYSRPWYELYEGGRPIVSGHCNYGGGTEPFVRRGRVFGLDTDCCRGGALSGLVLPDFELVSVPSRANHWSDSRARYEDVRLSMSPEETLTWEDLDRVLALCGACCGSNPGVAERERRVRAAMERGSRVLRDLFDHVVAESERVLAGLRVELPFDRLPPGEQAGRYAQRIGRSPLGKWLHLARAGELRREGMRRQLRRPIDAIRLAERAGLLVGAVEEEPRADPPRLSPARPR